MVLLSVALALRNQAAVSSLAHVTRTVSDFLTGPVGELTLARACELRSLALLDEIWDASCTAVEDHVPYWTPRNFLRSDKHYNRWQFTQSLLAAVRCDSLEVAKWLYRRFDRCTAEAVVVKEAARLGRLEILRFLLYHRTQPLNRLCSDSEAPTVGERNAVVWSAEAVTLAVRHGNADVARLLCTDAKLPLLTEALLEALRQGHYKLANWMISVQSGEETSSLKTSVGWRDVVQRLETRGDLRELPVFAAVLEVLLKHGDLERVKRFVANLDSMIITQLTQRNVFDEMMATACKKGDLAFVRGLVECRLATEKLFLDTGASQYGDFGDCSEDVRSYEGGVFVDFLGRAVILNAASNGHCDAILDLMVTACADSLDSTPSSLGQMEAATKEPKTAMTIAAVNGHVGILQYLHELRASSNQIQKVELGLQIAPTAVVAAAAAGHLQAVQWLHNRRYVARTQRKTMDGAAAGGHLLLVQWLHAIHSMGCTAQAMDKAAANGHLDVVQWLHENRSEGCTSAAMDEAAANGHMEVVQWLHNNRREGCTTAALDKAAANNDMRMVKWLCENTTAGCTTAAMDDAAANGNLEMVEWFHVRRTEGCTKAAMDSAAGNGHLRVVRWLDTNRIEGCSRAAMENAARGGHFEVLLYLRRHHAEYSGSRVLLRDWDPDEPLSTDIWDWLEERSPKVDY